jgi:hypothetical protein
MMWLYIAERSNELISINRNNESTAITRNNMGRTYGRPLYTLIYA